MYSGPPEHTGQQKIGLRFACKGSIDDLDESIQ